MNEGVTDRRVQKTRQLLKDALISLIIEKSFESVTIQEILDRANVGRSTFYIHYENKQELLHSCFEEFHVLFEMHDPAAGSGDIDKSDFILNLFRLVKNKHRLCSALLGRDDMSMFFNPVHQYIYTFIEAAIKKSLQNKKQISLQSEILVHYLTSALIGTLRWWVQNDMPCTPEEMDKYFKQLAAQDIKNLSYMNLN